MIKIDIKKKKISNKCLYAPRSMKFVYMLVEAFKLVI